jgi:hypothetical protein
MRRLAATVLCGAALAAPAAARAACSPTAAPDPSIPTWKSVNGYDLGSREATSEEIDGYLAAVDRASSRVHTAIAGNSFGGRPIMYALVSEPSRLVARRLDRLAARLRAVRAGRGRLPRGAAAFAWIAGGVHGDEPTGADADMQLLYELAAGRDCDTLARLHRLVTVLMPVQNPDGRAAHSRVNGAGFDLNRDWFARTQPETRAKVALLERYPPILFVDQHEEEGSAFFFPPNSDPVHHEISSEVLHAIANVYGPALRRAFDARGLPHVSSETYDLFFMGYGDSVPSTLFGAAGMTFEKGGAAPYAQRFDQHHLAAATALTAAATHEPSLLRAWARQWNQARSQGRRGVLQPNHTIVAGDRIQFPVPNRHVYAYAIRTDAHGADAAALADRLTSVGVEVDRLAAPLGTRALRPFGAAATRAATLPAGTYYVPMAQAAKHWVEAMLADDAYTPVAETYDVSAWSNPLLMGLSGGALQARPGRVALRRVHAADTVPEPDRGGAAAYTFAGGSEGSADLATALLNAGIGVSRLPASGAFAVSGSGDFATLRNVAADHGVSLVALDQAPAGAVTLRAPRVAMIAGDSGLSDAWARYLLQQRLGLAVDFISAADVATSRLSRGGYTALVVPDGAAAMNAINPHGLAALAAWVRGGGTLIGWQQQGVALARAAGVTAVTAVDPPPTLQVAGVLLRDALDDSDPVAWGEDASGFTFDTSDPLLSANGAPVVARYPSGSDFFVSGYAAGTGVLRGTVAATDEHVGAGRVVLFAFDPAFRGYAEGTERLVANALLAPSG